MHLYRHNDLYSMLSQLLSLNTEQKGRMAKRKKIELENIPTLLKDIVSLMDLNIQFIAAKTELTNEDSRTIIALADALTKIYKDHRAEIAEIKKDLQGRSKEEILELINLEKNK